MISNGLSGVCLEAEVALPAPQEAWSFLAVLEAVVMMVLFEQGFFGGEGVCVCVHVSVLTGSFYEAHVDLKLQTPPAPTFQICNKHTHLG